MHYDDPAWERSGNIAGKWVDELFADQDKLREVGNFLVKHRPGTPMKFCDPRDGYYNIIFRMEFQDGGSAVIRFPEPGVNVFPEKKVRNEVAAIRRKYIARHLFRKLAKDRRLTSSSNHDDGPFKLWCDDLRPANVLLNADLQAVEVSSRTPHRPNSHLRHHGGCYSIGLSIGQKEWRLGLEITKIVYEPF